MYALFTLFFHSLGKALSSHQLAVGWEFYLITMLHSWLGFPAAANGWKSLWQHSPPPPNKLASWLSPSARLTVGAGADHSSFTHKARSTKHSLASAWRACTLSGCKCWLGNPADDAVGIHIATPPLPLGGWTNFTSTSILNRFSGWLCSSRGCPLLGAGWPQWTDNW